MTFSFRVTSMPDLDGFAERYDLRALDDRLEDAARDTASNAKFRAPTGADSELRNSIQANRDGVARWSVSARKEYAAFVEFGTGPAGAASDQPGGLPDFYQHGGPSQKNPSPDMVKSVRRWMRKKGLDESQAYPVALSILRSGIKAQPFLRPAFLEKVAEMQRPGFWRRSP